MGDMITRADQIAYLEQHWSRQLAHELLDHAKAISELVDRNAYVNNGTEFMAQSLGIPRTLRAIAQDMREIAERSRLSIETARRIPDELLDDFVRYESKPEWRAAMEREGFTWNNEKLRWECE